MIKKLVLFDDDYSINYHAISDDDKIIYPTIDEIYNFLNDLKLEISNNNCSLPYTISFIHNSINVNDETVFSENCYDMAKNNPFYFKSIKLQECQELRHKLTHHDINFILYDLQKDICASINVNYYGEKIQVDVNGFGVHFENIMLYNIAYEDHRFYNVHYEDHKIEFQKIPLELKNYLKIKND